MRVTLTYDHRAYNLAALVWNAGGEIYAAELAKTYTQETVSKAVVAGLIELDTVEGGRQLLRTTPTAEVILHGEIEPEPPKRLAAYAFHIRSFDNGRIKKEQGEHIANLVADGYKLEQCETIADGQGGAVTFMYYVHPSRRPVGWQDDSPDHK